VLGTLLVSGVLCGVWLLYECRGVMVLFCVAILLATALMSPIGWLERLGASRPVAAIVMHMLVLTLLAAFVVAVFPVIAEQGRKLSAHLPAQYERLRTAMEKSPLKVVERMATQLPEKFDSQILSWNQTGDTRARTINDVWAVLDRALWGLFSVFAIFLLSVYWSIERRRAIRSCLILVATSRRAAVRDFILQVEDTLGAFVRGQALLCLLMGLMALAVYWLIGLPYVLALAALAGVLEALPVLGPMLGVVPPLLAAVSVGPLTAVWTLVAAAVMLSMEGYVVAPRIMNRSVGVHPVLTLLSIAALIPLLGPIGGVLAVPVAAIVQLVFNRYVFSSRSVPEPLHADQRDQRAVLLYRGRQLLHDLQRLMRQDQRESQLLQLENIEECVLAVLNNLSEAPEPDAGPP
jgi:predicted PurR-regulated permease PerM